jgi:hypothetical protein
MPTSLALLVVGGVVAAEPVFAASGIARAPIEATLVQGYLWAWGRWIRPSGLTGPMRPMPHGLTFTDWAGLFSSTADTRFFGATVMGESSSLLVKGTENNFQSGLIRFIVPMPSQSRSRDDAQSVPETHDLGPTAG